MAAIEIRTDNAPKAGGPYSQGVKSGNMIFCAGQIGVDPAKDALVEEGIEAETIQAIHNLEEVLKAAGATLSNVVRTDVFLSDMNNYSQFNEVYGKYFSSGVKPARFTVAAAALPKGALVEIAAIAVID